MGRHVRSPSGSHSDSGGEVTDNEEGAVGAAHSLGYSLMKLVTHSRGASSLVAALTYALNLSSSIKLGRTFRF